MKRIVSIVLAGLLLLSLASCGYGSAYRAIGLVTMQDRSTYSVSFYELSGYASETLRLASGEGELYYAATLEEGEVKVYYDVYGEKELLFTVKAGETVEGRGGYVEGGRRIHIIIETVGSAKNGSIRVSTKATEGEES